MLRRFLLAALLCVWPSFQSSAITCGFGSDIGGGVCRGFLTSPTGSLQTFTSPSDWNNSNNTIECIGGGASGGVSRGTSTNVSWGGGGAAYSAITSFVFAAPGTTTASYQLATGGASVTQSVNGFSNGNVGNATWFNNATDPAGGSDNSKCSAKGGNSGGATSGAPPQIGPNGGQASGSWGQTKFNGGAGGDIANAADTGSTAGGGGAAGPSGAGIKGTNTSAPNTATAGGNSDNNGTGSATGSAGVSGAGVQTSSAGGSGTESDSTHGSGASSGAARSTSGVSTSGSGGLYGGASGGALSTGATNAVSGAGRPGIIIITYTPATACPNKLTLLGVGCSLILPIGAFGFRRRKPSNDNADRLDRAA